MAVHSHVRTARSQIPDHTARTWSEVLERVLRIDATLNGVTLPFTRSHYAPAGVNPSPEYNPLQETIVGEDIPFTYLRPEIPAEDEHTENLTA